MYCFLLNIVDVSFLLFFKKSSIFVIGIVMSLRVLHGDIEKVREENPLLLKNITLTKKLGFPDVIMPGDVR